MPPTEDPNAQWFKNAVNVIRWCFVPFIIIGTMTNILNIIIFSKHKMRSLSTGNFLLALAFADLGTIYFQVNILQESLFLLEMTIKLSFKEMY